MRISDWSSDVCSSDLHGRQTCAQARLVTKYLIDAESAIYAMAERHSPLTERMEQCAPGDIAISAISFAEVALGTHNGKPPPTEVLDAFLAVIPMLPFDEAAARAYAGLPFRRARFDRLLAAHEIGSPSCGEGVCQYV